MDVVGNRSLIDLLDEQAGRHAEHAALVHQALDGATQRFSYAELHEASRRMAARFQKLGLLPGERVFVFLRNTPDFVPVWLGLNLAGLVFVPGNIHLTEKEVEFQLAHCEPKAVVTEALHHAVIEAVCARLAPGPRMVVTGTREIAGFEALEGLPGTADDYVRPPVTADTVAEILYTSGTSARPKGVLLTHANLLWCGMSGAAAFRLQSHDRYFNNKPLFHANCQDTVLSCLTAGATAIIGERYSATRYLGQLVEHGATVCSLSGMLCRTLLNQPESELDTAHQVRCAGYALNISREEVERFVERFGIRLRNGYGQSETMLYITAQAVDGPDIYPSIGTPAFEREVHIVDEANNILPPGAVGEIVVKGRPGRNVMLGYYKDEAATRQAFEGGWLHTGDLGYVDDKGRFHFYGRKKEVIKRAGENISAAEVEEALMSHALVCDVAVVGVPDPVRDQAVWAFVVVRADGVDQADLLRHCRERLAYFKVPERIVFLDDLPRNASGKLFKRELIERYGHAERAS